MRSFSTILASHDFFRGAILLFAFVLGGQAIWILTAEFYRPSRFGFPTNAQAAAATSANRNIAGLAASFGIIRGDLWAEYALTYLDVLQYDQTHGGGAPDNKTVEHAHEVADRALALAPYDARVWLILAGINWRLGQRPAAALRMSYYTGSNENELIPLRLFLAVNSHALADNDFQEWVRHDIRVIVSRKPELKAAILVSYRAASPHDRPFFERILEEIDPTLIAKLRSHGLQR